MSRFTRYKQESLLTNEGGYYEPDTHYMAIVAKLGQIEDILEEYGIEDLTDLKIALDYYNHRYDGLHTERVVIDDK